MSTPIYISLVIIALFTMAWYYNEAETEAVPTVETFSQPVMAQDPLVPSSFQEYIEKQGVDATAERNHREFVADRMKNTNQNIMGPTYAVGEMESDPVDWIGIRGRPAAIPVEARVGLQASVPDMDLSWFPKKQRVRW